MPDHPVTVASLAGELFAAGLTDAEVADALGIQLADVCRLPEYAEARLGPAHVVRVERELYAAALPGESWREASVAGEIVRLAAYRAPDTAAAKALLAAIEPERYSPQGPALRVAVTVATFDAAGRRQLPEGPGVAGGATFDAKATVVGSGTLPSPADRAVEGPPVHITAELSVADEGPPVVAAESIIFDHERSA